MTNILYPNIQKPLKLFQLAAFPLSFNHTNKRIELCIWGSLTFFLLGLAMFIPPLLLGDGQYYYAMLYGLANNGSPELSQDVINHLKHLGWDLSALSITANNQKSYAVHFFFYSLLCTPAYISLDVLGLNTLKAFQLTNALLISLATYYVLILTTLSRPSQWLILIGFLFSTGTIYFQWTSPEIFSTVCILISSIAFLDKRFKISILFCSLSALQNPSCIFFLPIILATQFIPLFLKHHFKDYLIEASKTAPLCLITIIPYIWFIYLIGEPSAIVSKGYINTQLIGIDRLISFIFDLNQGLIVGYPLLLWIFPCCIFIRILKYVNQKSNIRVHDLLILGFFLVSIPTLSQSNWNAGHSVFMRYTTWAGIFPLVWCAATLSSIKNSNAYIIAIPSLIIQCIFSSLFGGINVTRLEAQRSFKSWVTALWHSHPHIYNPDPEIFYERVQRAEGFTKTPYILYSDEGHILKVLSQQKTIEAISKEVCGEGQILTSIDSKPQSQRVIIPYNSNFTYLNGHLKCLLSRRDVTLTFPISNSFKPSSIMSFHQGWYPFEKNGVWSHGYNALIRLNLDSEQKNKYKISFNGRVWIKDFYPEQIINIKVKDKISKRWSFHYPSRNITPDKHSIIVSSEDVQNNTLEIEFYFPTAIAPIDAGDSRPDTRTIAMWLSSIEIQSLL